MASFTTKSDDCNDMRGMSGVFVVKDFAIIAISIIIIIIR